MTPSTTTTTLNNQSDNKSETTETTQIDSKPESLKKSDETTTIIKNPAEKPTEKIEETITKLESSPVESSSSLDERKTTTNLNEITKLTDSHQHESIETTTKSKFDILTVKKIIINLLDAIFF